MERFQEKAVKELRAYVNQTWNEEAEERFPRLLLRLPPLRSLQPGLMEELFFAALIGTVHIDSVIPYILRMDSTEYNGQFSNLMTFSSDFATRLTKCLDLQLEELYPVRADSNRPLRCLQTTGTHQPIERKVEIGYNYGRNDKEKSSVCVCVFDID